MTDFNVIYIFEEFDDEYLQEYLGEKYVVWPIEGPALLKMQLSKRQLEELKYRLDKLPINPTDTVHTVTIAGRTRPATEPKIKKTCTCSIITLMQTGCKCGVKI